MSAPIRLLAPSRARRLAAIMLGLCALALLPGAAALAAHHGASVAQRRSAAEARCLRARSGASHARGAKAAQRRAAAERLCAKAGLIGTKRKAPVRKPPVKRERPVRERAPVTSAPLTPGGETTPEPEAPRGRKGAPGTGGGGIPQDEGSTVTDPIDPRFLTKDPFGATSFWLQPWRAYLDTWSASALTGSLGINFNVGALQAEPVAQLLSESGFKLARREIPWGGLSYDEPSKFRNEARIEMVLTALHNHGLRPLLLLNANSGMPNPAKPVTLTTTASAPPGAMTVHLDPASAALVVPGKTGFDGITWGSGPDVLITSVNEEGLATLSRPLRTTLAAGNHAGMLLRYAPFQNPKLPNGERNPAFQETLNGWLEYVGAVNALATRIVGAGNYDLEVWNELSFGSQFLNAEHYYQPADARTREVEAEAQGAIEAQDQPGAPEDAETEESPETRANAQAIEGIEAETAAPEESPAEEGSGEGAPAIHAAAAPAEAGEEEEPARDTTKAIINPKVTKAVTNTLLKETVAYVRNPANGISPAVGITDGFASQTPFPSGALAPVGLTALSKHLYNGAKQFPANYKEGRLKPLNALGFRDTVGERGFKPLFVPSFQELFPEYFLSAISTETLVRDIAPITTTIYGLKHGREVGPAGGSPVQKWMTEYNMPPGKGTVMQADGTTPAGITWTPADRAHYQAKALMRALVANVNKGLSREYFFAAAPGALSLISKAFYTELEAHPESYPGSALGGETMSGFRELMSHMQGPGPEGAARQLKLDSITEEGSHAQFAGDGTAAHPALADRDVLAVLPFQAAPNKFVIPVYVMTRDLMTLYSPGKPESDVTRFDLPAENFTIKLSNLPGGGAAPTVSAYDPLRRESTPARLISREGETAEFEIAATDYPRLLTLEFP